MALSAVVFVAPGAARADCESGIGELSRAMRAVTDPHLSALLQTDLRGAEVELWEFDEVECATVLAHAARLLAGLPQAQQGSQPAAAAPLPAPVR